MILFIPGINLPYNLGPVTGHIPLQKFFHLTPNSQNSLETFPNFKLLAMIFFQFYEKGTLIFRARLIPVLIKNIKSINFEKNCFKVQSVTE